MIHIARWQIVIIVLILVGGIVFAAPNFMGYGPNAPLPGWLPDSRVSLGLDLQGGSHLLYEVDVDQAIEKRLARVRDDVERRLGQARIAAVGVRLDRDAVRFQLHDVTEQDSALDLLRSPLRRDGLQLEIAKTGLTTITLTSEEVAAFQRRLVDQSIEVIRRRVDALGTREPTILRQGEDRILIQVPGVGDPETLRCIIGKTGALTFQLVDMSATPPADLSVSNMSDPCDPDATTSGAAL